VSLVTAYVRFPCRLSYTDRSCALQDDRTEEIREIVSTTPFRLHALKLESVFASSPALSTESLFASSPALSTSLLSTASISAPTPLESLQTLLSPTTHSPTSLRSLHTSLLHSLLRQTARTHDCDILLMGETATRVAIKTISGMAEGRGWSMGEEVGSEWDAEGVMVVRPMSLMLAKEVEFWNRLKGLQSLVVVNPGTTVEAKKAGIEALTEGARGDAGSAEETLRGLKRR
jgi:cytoplasmic tRNA 2-thiolation protein 2